MLTTLIILWLLGIPLAACIVVVGHRYGVPEDEIRLAATKAVLFWPWPFIEGAIRRR